MLGEHSSAAEEPSGLKHKIRDHQFVLTFILQVYIELVELREMGAARSMLRQTSPLEHMLKEEPGRYKHLEDLLSKPYFDVQDV